MFKTMPPSILKVPVDGSGGDRDKAWSSVNIEGRQSQDEQMQAPLRADSTRLAQAFLLASRAGGDLHKHWQRLVETYVKRNLTEREDIFPAISGLAARYPRNLPIHEYLAGPWRSTFAYDLVWACEPVLLPRENMHNRYHLHGHRHPYHYRAHCTCNVAARMNSLNFVTRRTKVGYLCLVETPRKNILASMNILIYEWELQS
jgi:hypothetical protein